MVNMMNSNGMRQSYHTAAAAYSHYELVLHLG